MRKEAPIYQADGLAMRSQLFLEHAPGPRAGVLVFPEIFGLGAHAIGRAERPAVLGHVALACDLQEGMGLLQPLFANPSRTRSRASGALRTLTARPEVDSARVAAIGCCFPTPRGRAIGGGPIELAWVILKHAEPTTEAASAWVSAYLSTAPKPAQ